jgi:hypothetical protein
LHGGAAIVIPDLNCHTHLFDKERCRSKGSRSKGSFHNK